MSVLSHAVVAQDDPTIKPLPSFLDTIEKKAPDTSDSSSAEEDISAPQKDEPKAKMDMSDIPDEFIDEASQFGEDCRNHHEMPMYFDCRCMGVKFLDARMELGASASKSEVQNRLGKACKDGTGIAGQLYERCLNDFVNAPENVGPEEYCSCYGNTFAKLFEDWPSLLTQSAKVALTSKAQLICQNPEAARRIYGPGAVVR